MRSSTSTCVWYMIRTLLWVLTASPERSPRLALWLGWFWNTNEDRRTSLWYLSFLREFRFSVEVNATDITISCHPHIFPFYCLRPSRSFQRVTSEPMEPDWLTLFGHVATPWIVYPSRTHGNVGLPIHWRNKPALALALFICTSNGNTMNMRRHDSVRLYFYKQNSGLHKVSREKQHLLWSWSQCPTGPAVPFFIKGKTQSPFLWISAIANSDHLPVLCKKDKSLKQLDSRRTRRIWCYNKADPRKLSLELRKSDWRPVSKAENVDAAWEAWENIFISVVCKTCTVETNYTR